MQGAGVQGAGGERSHAAQEEKESFYKYRMLRLGLCTAEYFAPSPRRPLSASPPRLPLRVSPLRVSPAPPAPLPLCPLPPSPLTTAPSSYEFAPPRAPCFILVSLTLAIQAPVLEWGL